MVMSAVFLSHELFMRFTCKLILGVNSSGCFSLLSVLLLFLIVLFCICTLQRAHGFSTLGGYSGYGAKQGETVCGIRSLSILLI